MADPKEQYQDTSRYYHLLEEISFDDITGQNIPGMMKDVEFPESEDDQYHITQFTDLINIENVAYQYYGEAKYWWVIAIANNIIDLFDDDDIQLTLRIPSFNTLRTVLEGIE
jgi:hypothetical protein